MFTYAKPIGLFLVLTLSQLFLSACDHAVEETALGEEQSYVQVWDAYRRPIPNARIQIGDSFYVTDEDGLLVIEKSLNDIPVIKISKQGYVDKTARVLKNTNAVVVLLMPQTQWQDVAAIEQAQSIRFADVELLLPAYALITHQGIEAEGAAKVSITPWLPEGNLAPASFASNETYQAGVLAPLFSHAMFHIAMIDDQGETLNIADNKAITVRQTLSSEPGLDAEQAISLWLLDDATGLWLEHRPAQLFTEPGGVLHAEISRLGAWSWAHTVNASRHVNLSCALEDESGSILAVPENEACYARVQLRYPDQKLSVIDVAIPSEGTAVALDDDVELSVLAFHLRSKSFAQKHFSAGFQLSDELNLVAKSGVLQAQSQAVFVECQFIREGKMPLSIPCDVSAGFRQQDDVYAPWTWQTTSVAEGGGLLLLNAPGNTVQKFDVQSAYMPECPLETDSPEKYLLDTDSMYKIEHLTFSVQCADSVYSE
ncbi:MAG: hypothetical protein HRU20_10855 [Pseudomonadales bacterium]|nr:hypothetical protein [Pseudomonadales bacterium]